MTYGDVYYFDSNTWTYADTGVDMPVPVTNYDIALLWDGSQWGMYIFGGRHDQHDAGLLSGDEHRCRPDRHRPHALAGGRRPGGPLRCRL